MDETQLAVPRPVSSAQRLTLVPTQPGTVHRTFADAAETRRSGPPWRRRERRMPAGLVHAAELVADRSLCGLPLDSLHEFGRSRYAFEHFEAHLRCSACHAAAGSPDS
ncbi:hypothetical protein [Nocardioides cynanchi]|uniref:hypothetical protein n=1 Tax=Nocardioides cynanchi TaxID=2558918 RepID=UPI00177B19AE|nr:hypothetical protein [Nocardioides cynanchi]